MSFRIRKSFFLFFIAPLFVLALVFANVFAGGGSGFGANVNTGSPRRTVDGQRRDQQGNQGGQTLDGRQAPQYSNQMSSTPSATSTPSSTGNDSPQANRSTNIQQIVEALHPEDDEGNPTNSDDAKRLRAALLFLGLGERFYDIGAFAPKYKKIGTNGTTVENSRPGGSNQQANSLNSFKTIYQLAIPELDDYYALWRVLWTQGSRGADLTHHPQGIFQDVDDDTTTPWKEKNLLEKIALTASKSAAETIFNSKNPDNTEENLISHLAIAILAKIVAGRSEQPADVDAGPVTYANGKVTAVKGLFSIIKKLTNPATIQGSTRNTSGSIYMSSGAQTSNQAALTGKLRQQVALLLLANELAGTTNPLTLPSNSKKSANFGFFGFRSGGKNNGQLRPPVLQEGTDAIKGLINSLFRRRSSTTSGGFTSSSTLDATKTSPMEYVAGISGVSPEYNGFDDTSITEENEHKLRLFNAAAGFYNLVVLRAAHAIDEDKVGVQSADAYDNYTPSDNDKNTKVNSSWLTDMAGVASNKLADLLRTEDTSDSSTWTSNHQNRFFHDLMAASALHEIYYTLEVSEEDTNKLTAQWTKTSQTSSKRIIGESLKGYLKTRLFRNADLSHDQTQIPDTEGQSQSRLFEWKDDKNSHSIYRLTLDFFRTNATELKTHLKEEEYLNTVQLFYLMIIWRDRAKNASSDTTASEVAGFTEKMNKLETGANAVDARNAVHSAEIDLLIFFLMNFARNRTDLDTGDDSAGIGGTGGDTTNTERNIMRLYYDFTGSNNFSSELTTAITAIGMLTDISLPTSATEGHFNYQESPWKLTMKFRDNRYNQGTYITRSSGSSDQTVAHSTKANRIRKNAVILHDLYAVNDISASEKRDLKKGVAGVIASILTKDEAGRIVLALLLFGAIGLFTAEQKTAFQANASKLNTRYTGLFPDSPDSDNPTPIEKLLNKDSTTNKVLLIEIASLALRLSDVRALRKKLINPKTDSEPENLGLEVPQIQALASLFVEMIDTVDDRAQTQESTIDLLDALQTKVTTTNNDNPLQSGTPSEIIKAIQFIFGLEAGEGESGEITSALGRRALTAIFENEFSVPVAVGSSDVKKSGSFKFSPESTTDGTTTPARLSLLVFLTTNQTTLGNRAEVTRLKNNFLDLFTLLGSTKTAADFEFTEPLGFLDNMFPSTPTANSAKLRLAFWHLSFGYQLWNTGVLCQDNRDSATTNSDHQNKFMTQKALLLPELQNYYRFWNLIKTYDGSSHTLTQRESDDDTRTYNRLSKLARAADKSAAQAILRDQSIPIDALTILNLIVKGASETTISVQKSGNTGDKTIVADGLFKVFSDLSGNQVGESLHETPNSSDDDRKLVSDETRNSLSLILFAYQIQEAEDSSDDSTQVPEETADVNSDHFRSWSYDSSSSTYQEEDDVVEAMKDALDFSDDSPDSSSLANYLPITKEEVNFWLSWESSELGTSDGTFQNNLADASNDFVILVNLRLPADERATQTDTTGGRTGGTGDQGGTQPEMDETNLKLALQRVLESFNLNRGNSLTASAIEAMETSERKRFAADLLLASALYKIFKTKEENWQFDTNIINSSTRIIPTALGTYLTDNLFELQDHASLFAWPDATSSDTHKLLKIAELLLLEEEGSVLTFLNSRQEDDPFFTTPEAELLLKIFQNRNIAITSSYSAGTIEKNDKTIQVSSFTAQMATLGTVQADARKYPIEIELALFVLYNTARDRGESNNHIEGQSVDGNAENNFNLMKDSFSSTVTEVNSFSSAVTALGLLLEWEFPENGSSNKKFALLETAWEKTANEFTIYEYYPNSFADSVTKESLRRRAGALHDFYVVNALEQTAKDTLRKETAGIVAQILLSANSKASLLSMLLFAAIGLMSAEDKAKLGTTLSSIKSQYEAWTPATNPANDTVEKALKDLLTIPQGSDGQGDDSNTKSKLAKIVNALLASDAALATIKNRFNSLDASGNPKSSDDELKLDTYGIKALLKIFIKMMRVTTPSGETQTTSFNNEFKKLNQQESTFTSTNSLLNSGSESSSLGVRAIAEFFGLQQSERSEAINQLNAEAVGFRIDFAAPATDSADSSAKTSGSFKRKIDNGTPKLRVQEFYPTAPTGAQAQTYVDRFLDFHHALSYEATSQGDQTSTGGTGTQTGNLGAGTSTATSTTPFNFLTYFLDDLFPADSATDTQQQKAIKLRLAFLLLSFGRDFKELGVFETDSSGAEQSNYQISFKTQKPLELAALENYYRFWNLLDQIDGENNPNNDDQPNPNGDYITGASPSASSSTSSTTTPSTTSPSTTSPSSARSFLQKIAIAANRSAARALFTSTLTDFMRRILKKICDGFKETTVNVAVTQVSDIQGTDLTKFTTNGLNQVFIDLNGTASDKTLNNTSGALTGASAPGKVLSDATRRKLALIALVAQEKTDWNFQLKTDSNNKKDFGFQEWEMSGTTAQKKTADEVDALVATLLTNKQTDKGSLETFLSAIAEVDFWPDSSSTDQEISAFIDNPGRFYNLVVLRTAEEVTGDSNTDTISSIALQKIYKQAIDKIALAIVGGGDESAAVTKRKGFAHSLFLASALKRAFDAETGNNRLSATSKKTPTGSTPPPIVDATTLAPFLRALFALDGSTLFNWPDNASGDFGEAPTETHKVYKIAEALLKESGRVTPLKSSLKNKQSSQAIFSENEIFLLFSIYSNLNEDSGPTKVKKFQEQIDRLSDANNGRSTSGSMGIPIDVKRLIFMLYELARNRNDLDLNGNGSIDASGENSENNVNLMKKFYFDTAQTRTITSLKAEIAKLKFILPIVYPIGLNSDKSFLLTGTSFKLVSSNNFNLVQMRSFTYSSLSQNADIAEYRKKGAYLHDYYRASSISTDDKTALKNQSNSILAGILIGFATSFKANLLSLILFASIALLTETQKTKLGTIAPELKTLFDEYAPSGAQAAKTVSSSLKYILTPRTEDDETIVPLIEIVEKALESGVQVSALTTKITSSIDTNEQNAHAHLYDALAILMVRTFKLVVDENDSSNNKNSIVYLLNELNEQAAGDNASLLNSFSSEQDGSPTLGGAVYQLFTYSAADITTDTPAWDKEFTELMNLLNEVEDGTDVATTTGKFNNNFACADLATFQATNSDSTTTTTCGNYRAGSFQIAAPSTSTGDGSTPQVRNLKLLDFFSKNSSDAVLSLDVDVLRGRFLDLLVAFDTDNSALIDTAERKAMAKRIAADKRFRLAIAIVGAAMALDRIGAFEPASSDSQTPAVAELADLLAVLKAFQAHKLPPSTGNDGTSTTQPSTDQSLVGIVFVKDNVNYDTKLNYFASLETAEPIKSELLKSDNKKQSEDFNIERADFLLLQKLYFSKKHTAATGVASKKGIYEIIKELNSETKAFEDTVKNALALVLLMESVEEDTHSHTSNTEPSDCVSGTERACLLKVLERYKLKADQKTTWDHVLAILKTIVDFDDDNIETPEAITIKTGIPFFAATDAEINTQDDVTEKYRIFYNYYALKASGKIPATQAKTPDGASNPDEVNMINQRWLDRIRKRTIHWFVAIFLQDENALDKVNFLYELSLLNVIHRLASTLSRITVQSTGSSDSEVHEPIPFKLARIYNNLVAKTDIDFYEWNDTESNNRVNSVRTETYNTSSNTGTLTGVDLKTELKNKTNWSAENLFAFLFLWNKRKVTSDNWNLKEAGQQLTGDNNFDSTLAASLRIYQLFQLFFTLDTNLMVNSEVKEAYNAFQFLRKIGDNEYYYAASGSDPAQTKIDIAFKNGNHKSTWNKSETDDVVPQIEQTIVAYEDSEKSSATAALIQTRAATFHDIVLAQNVKKSVSADKTLLNNFRDSITNEIVREYRKDKRALLALGLLGALRYLQSQEASSITSYNPKTDTDRLNNEAEYIAESAIEALDFVLSIPATADDIWRLPAAARSTPVSATEILTKAKSSPAINTANLGLAQNESTLQDYLKKKGTEDTTAHVLNDDRIFEINDFLLNTQNREDSDNNNNYKTLLSTANTNRNTMVEQDSDDFAEGQDGSKKQTKSGLTRRLFLLVHGLLNRPNDWQFESVIEMIGLYNADISSFESNENTGKPEVSEFFASAFSDNFGTAAQTKLKDSVKIYLDYAIIRAQLQRYYEIVRDLEATSTTVAAFRYISSPNFLALLERLWALLNRDNNALSWETVADLFEGTGIVYTPAQGSTAAVDNDWWRDVYSIAPTQNEDDDGSDDDSSTSQTPPTLDIEGTKDKQKLSEEHFFKTEKRAKYNNSGTRILRTEANHEAVLRIDPEQLAIRLDRFEGAFRQAQKDRLLGALRIASNERETIASLLGSERLFDLIRPEFLEIMNSELAGEHAGIRELILLFIERALDDSFIFSTGMKTSLISALATLFENAFLIGDSTRSVFEQERSRAAELLLDPEAVAVLELLNRHPAAAEAAQTGESAGVKALISIREFLPEIVTLIEGDRLRFEPLMEWLESLEFDRLFALGRNPLEAGETPSALDFSTVKTAIETKVDAALGITAANFKNSSKFELTNLITQLKRLSWNRPATRELLGSLFSRELFELMTGTTAQASWEEDDVKSALRSLTDEQLAGWRRAEKVAGVEDSDRIDIIAALTDSIEDYLESELWGRAIERAEEIAPIIEEIDRRITAAANDANEKARWTELFSSTGINFWDDTALSGKFNPFTDQFTGLKDNSKSTLTQDQIHEIIALDSEVLAAELLEGVSDHAHLEAVLLELAPTLATIADYRELMLTTVDTNNLPTHSSEAPFRRIIEAKKLALSTAIWSSSCSKQAFVFCSVHERIAALDAPSLSETERNRALLLLNASLSPRDRREVQEWNRPAADDATQTRLEFAWSEMKTAIINYTRSIFRDSTFLEQINRIARNEGFALLLDNNGVPATVDSSGTDHTKRRELLQFLTAIGIDVFAPDTMEIYGAETINNDHFVFEEDERNTANKIWIDSLRFAPSFYKASTPFAETLKAKIDAAEAELWQKANVVLEKANVKERIKKIVSPTDTTSTDSVLELFADVGLEADWFSSSDGSLNNLDSETTSGTHGNGINDNLQSLNHAQLLRIVNPAFALAMASTTEFAEVPPTSSSWTAALRAVGRTGLEQALERIRLFREIGLRQDRFPDLYEHIAGSAENAVPTPAVWDVFIDYLEMQNIEALSGVALAAADLESFKRILMAEQVRTKLDTDFTAIITEVNKSENIEALLALASAFNGDETEIFTVSDLELLLAHLEISSGSLAAKTGADAPGFEQKARIIAALGGLLYDRAEEVVSGEITNLTTLVADEDWKKLVQILRPLFDLDSDFLLDDDLPESLHALRDFGRDWDGFRDFGESDGALPSSVTDNRKLHLAAQTGLLGITARDYLLDAIELFSRTLLEFIFSPDAPLAATLGLLDATNSSAVIEGSAGKLFANLVATLKPLEKLARQRDLYAGIYHDRTIGTEIEDFKAAFDALATKIKTDVAAGNSTTVTLTDEEKKSFYNVFRIDLPLSTFVQVAQQTAHETARNTLENALFSALEDTNLETLLDLLTLLESAGPSLLAEDVTALSFFASVVPLFGEAASRTALENLVLFGDLSRLKDEIARLDFSALSLRPSAVLDALKTTVLALDASEQFAFELGTTLRNRIAFLTLRSLVLLAGEVRAGGSAALRSRSLLWLAANVDILETFNSLGSFHFRDRNDDGLEDRIAALSAEDRLVSAQLRNERSAVQLIALDSRETLATSIDNGIKQSIFSAFDPEVGWSELYSLWEQRTGPERLALARDLRISLVSMRIFDEWSMLTTQTALDTAFESFRAFDPEANDSTVASIAENEANRQAFAQLQNSLFNLEERLGRAIRIRGLEALARRIKVLLGEMTDEKKAELQRRLDLRRFGFTIEKLETMVATDEKRTLWAEWQFANATELETIFRRESILDLLAGGAVQASESPLLDSILKRAGIALRDDSLLRGLLGEATLESLSGVDRIEANSIADRIFIFNELERSQKLLAVLRFLETIAAAAALGIDLQSIVGSTDADASLLNGNFDFGITEDDFIFDPATGDVAALANPIDLFSRFPETEWNAGMKVLFNKTKDAINTLTKKIAKSYRDKVKARNPASPRLVAFAAALGIQSIVPVLPPLAASNLAFAYGLVLPDRIDTDRLLRYAVDNRIAVLVMNVLVHMDQHTSIEEFDPTLRDLSPVQIVRRTPPAPLSRISRTRPYAILFQSALSSFDFRDRENQVSL